MKAGRPLVVLLLLIGACSGYRSDASPTTVATPLVLGVPVAEFFQATCAACHGTDRSGVSGPALLPVTLVENDAFYATTIMEGRPELGMPAWGAAAGFSEQDLANLVGFLRTDPASTTSAAENTADIDGVGVIAAGPVEVGGSVQFTWTLTNRSGAPLDLIRFSSPSFSVFLLDTLPLPLGPGESVDLHGVFVPDFDAEPGVEAHGDAAVETSSGGLRRVTLTATPTPPAHTLAFTEVGLPSQPVRLATWGSYLYVGYFNGLIDVFRFTDTHTLERIEQIETIAETLNHGPDGTPQPEQTGRLIGGLALDERGTLYVTHGDPRLNEGEFVQTGHLADLNSGTLTALDGPPGQYRAAGHRRDLITGLPRNVTNHMPLGLAYRDGKLFIAVGGMTDSGAVDPSKPNPDSEISGTILRLDLEAGAEVFPIVLTPPGPVFATAADLIPGVLEVWATGVRNGFGLTFHQGELYLTDQGSDGGAAPPPAPGVPGFGPNFGPDHLHRVTEGAFLGQPNQARNQLVLNDGSSYVTHVDSPWYAPPVHFFGIHNSATGIVTYHGALFPELEGQLLVAKFSGSLGAQALDIDGDRVAVTVIAGLPTVRNITDIAVGSDGQIVLADFWGLRLLVATAWE